LHREPGAANGNAKMQRYRNVQLYHQPSSRSCSTYITTPAQHIQRRLDRTDSDVSDAQAAEMIIYGQLALQFFSFF